jgi:hypothetical protein
MKSQHLFTRWSPISQDQFRALTKGRRFATEMCNTLARDAEIQATLFLSKKAPAFLVAKEKTVTDEVAFSYFRAEGDLRAEGDELAVH